MDNEEFIYRYFVDNCSINQIKTDLSFILPAFLVLSRNRPGNSGGVAVHIGYKIVSSYATANVTVEDVIRASAADISTSDINPDQMANSKRSEAHRNRLEEIPEILYGVLNGGVEKRC
jgi:hypothetical protein